MRRKKAKQVKLETYYVRCTVFAFNKKSGINLLWEVNSIRFPYQIGPAKIDCSDFDGSPWLGNNTNNQSNEQIAIDRTYMSPPSQ